MKAKPKKKLTPPPKKKKPAPEPRAAAPVPAAMPGPDEVVKTPDLPAGGVTEEELDEEAEAVSDGSEIADSEPLDEDEDDVPPEVDEDDDEGYF